MLARHQQQAACHMPMVQAWSIWCSDGGQLTSGLEKDMQSTGVTPGDPAKLLVLPVHPQAFGCPPQYSSLAESQAATVLCLCRADEEEQWVLLQALLPKWLGPRGLASDSLTLVIHPRQLAGAAREPGWLQPRQNVSPRASPVTLASSPWLNPHACSHKGDPCRCSPAIFVPGRPQPLLY